MGMAVYNSASGNSRGHSKNRYHLGVLGDHWSILFLLLAVGIFSFRLALALMNSV